MVSVAPFPVRCRPLSPLLPFAPVYPQYEEDDGADEEEYRPRKTSRGTGGRR